MNKALRTADRWAPGVIALVTLLAILTYILSQERVNGRLEGRLAELREQADERISIEVALRQDVQLWQAYVVSLKETMIKAGIENVPTPPRPVAVFKGPEGAQITNQKKER